MPKVPQIQITDSPLRLAQPQPSGISELALTDATPKPEPHQTPPRSQTDSEPHRAGAGPPLDEPLAGVYADVPRSLAAALEEAVTQLGAYRERPMKRELIAALLWKHVDPGQAGNVLALDELLSAYAQARRPS